MNIGGIGSPGVDYSRYATDQQTQKQEALEQQEEQAVTVQQPSQSQEAGTKAQSQTTAQSGASAAAGMSSQLAETLETSDDDDTTDQALINKANSGSTLTQSELSRLKEADPGLYSSVVKAEQAREELRNQMKQNPSGAKQAVQSAISQNNSEGQEIVRKALADEYGNFASKYDQVELSGAAAW